MSTPLSAIKREAVLRSLTEQQREAICAWLEDENDYTSELASFAWRRAWLPQSVDA